MFGSKFSNKCKHAAKCIRERVETIVKKKQAMLRFLKKDVADLLAAGHDDNAFRRIDALIVEINHASCYHTIEKCCEYIVRQLPSLEKQRECSPEVMEVMGTLIFAAARFSDLPELCDLRRFFVERYGGDMQSSANAEFVEKVQKKTFPKEKKLQLMQSIAEEFSVRWDSQMFGHKLSNSPSSKSDPTKKVVPSKADNKPPSTMDSQMNKVVPSRDKIEHTAASLPRRQQIPREAQIAQMVSTPKNIHLHNPEEKNSKVVANESESPKKYASHPKIPQYMDSKRNYNVTHKEDEPKDSIQHSRRPKAEGELDSVDQDKQRLSTTRYRDDKPVKSVPPYIKLNGNNNDFNVEGAKRNGMSPYAKADETKNVYPVKDNIKNVLENVELSHHEERLDPPRQERRNPVQPASNDVRAANMIPPYVKPKAMEVVQEDTLIRGSNVAAHDNSKDIEDRDGKVNGYYADKPKPFSVRRNFRNRPAMETDNMPINEEKSSSNAYGGGSRPTDKQSSIVYDRDRNDAETISRKDSRSPVEDEMANVGNRIRMPRTSRVQTKEGNEHLADVDDGKYDETDIKHEKPNYHATGGRRYKVEQNTSAREEHTTTGKNSKQPFDEEDEKDNAIDYGNLFARTSNGRRRHGSRLPAAGHDDEEMTMDRLLMHYSRKGKERDPGKERRKRDLGANGFEHPSNGANGLGHHPRNGEEVPSRRKEPNFPPVRALSVPPEPVSPEAIKTPARTVSMQPDLLAPNCGRVHPKLPDYDHLAARLAALRNL